jgi:YcaO-like protein with predicted kinase domain
MTEDRNTLEHWKAIGVRKYSDEGVERALEPGETLAVARTAAIRGGIVLPTNVSVNGGKQATTDEVRAGGPDNDFALSSMMEEIEHHAGALCDYDVVVSSYRDLSMRTRCVRPVDIIIPELCELTDDLILEWVCGYDLVSRSEVFVPLNAVLCPYRPQQGAMVFYACTNGLASGNTRLEALCHAICEIIERDAQAIALARSCVAPVLHSFTNAKADDHPVSHPRRISLHGLPHRASDLVSQLECHGISVCLRDLTSTAGIATIECILVEQTPEKSARAYSGAGAHPDARVAVWRSITEAAQSRAAVRNSTDSGIPEIRHKSVQQIDTFLSSNDWISFEQLPSFEHQYIDQDVEFLLSSLPTYGLTHVIAFDLTRPEVGVPVVRTILPKAETWHIFHLLMGRGKFGPRILQELAV